MEKRQPRCRLERCKSVGCRRRICTAIFCGCVKKIKQTAVTGVKNKQKIANLLVINGLTKMCVLSRVQKVKRLFFNRLRGTGRQPPSAFQAPPTALRRPMANRLLFERNMQGDARRCAVKSPMWNDEPTRSIGFGISLWPTASMFYTRVEDYSTKLRRNHKILREFCA